MDKEVSNVKVGTIAISIILSIFITCVLPHITIYIGAPILLIGFIYGLANIIYKLLMHSGNNHDKN